MFIGATGDLKSRLIGNARSGRPKPASQNDHSPRTSVDNLSRSHMELGGVTCPQVNGLWAPLEDNLFGALDGIGVQMQQMES